jgi:hypothetical protein
MLSISDYGPSEEFAGGLVLAKEMRILEKFFEVDWRIYSSHDSIYSYNVPKTSNNFIFGKPGEKLPKFKNRILRVLVSQIFERLVIRNWIRIESKKLQNFLDSEKYDYVFISLQGQLLPRLVGEINFKELNVIVQYWDPFTWWARVHNLTKFMVSRTLESYKIVNERANKILVPSVGMKDSIEAELSLRKMSANKVNTLFIPVHELPQSKKVPNDVLEKMYPYSIKIVFAGTLYAISEFGLLIKALDAMAWKLGEKSIGLFTVGSTEIPSELNRPQFHKIQRVSESITDLILMDADLCFLPYPLSSEDISKESFPSKLSTYVAIGNPILVIASRDSSLAHFLEANGWERGIVSIPSVTNVVGELQYLLSEKGSTSNKALVSNLKNGKLSTKKFEETLTTVFGLNDLPQLNQDTVIFRCEPPNDKWMKINNVTHRLIYRLPHSFPYKILRALLRIKRASVRSIILILDKWLKKGRT